MMFVYRFLYVLLKTLLIVLGPFLGAKTKKWIQMRSAVPMGKISDVHFSESIWIHASSGEIEYAKALIQELKKRDTSLSIVVTYSSESAEKLFSNIRPFVDAFLPLPWDDIYSISSLIKRINPKALIIARTDLWPELITQCERRQIPMGLISYVPRPDRLSFKILKPFFKKFSFISCIDAEGAAQLQDLNIPVFADGDTRFDQAFIRLQQPARLRLQSTAKVFTFGSTWPEDEAQLKKLWQEILNKGQKIVLSPHDVSPSRLAEIYRWLENEKYTYHKLSETPSPIQFTFQVLVIDQIGFLADAYRDSDFAFIGGSFKSRVHSVMEPLCAGLPVLVGPYIQNSPEAVKYAQRFVHVAQNSQELIHEYQILNATDLSLLKKQIIEEMEKNKGASEKIANFILNTLLKKVNS